MSRHQDRAGAGNALTYEMHREDMAIVRELGANTIRLAHYQHAQEFYDLCDENGIIVWAEIPYITMHMADGTENTLSQMKELIVQNYHHPSIVCWGLSNEITAASAVNEELLENHRRLNNLCHELDYGGCLYVRDGQSDAGDTGYEQLQSLFWLVHRGTGTERQLL